MAELHIIFDPLKPPLQVQQLPASVKTARISVGDDLSRTNVYELARRLAELLLDQLV